MLFTPFVEMAEGVSGEQKALRLYGYAIVSVLQVILFLWRGWKQSLRIVRAPISLFVLWCALSLAWTQHYDLTGKRLVLLGLVYCGTSAAIIDLSAQRSLTITRLLLLAMLILNFIVAITVPEIGTHVGGSEVGGLDLWRGIMAHKNIAGMLCAITVIMFSFDAGRIPVTARAIVIAAALLFLYMAWSKTAWISLPIALVAGGVLALTGARQSSAASKWRELFLKGLVGLYAIVILMIIAATLQGDVLLSLTNNTSALTGRAAIWRPMIQFYLDHPFLGSGYGAYWDASADLVDINARSSGIWKNVDQGHNGFLDLLVQVGIPGFALALYAAFVWPARRLTGMMNRRTERAALTLSLLIFFLLENFSESSLLADDALGNAFLLIALAFVQRDTLNIAEGKRSGRSGEAFDLSQQRETRQKRYKTVD